jgi:hypothetical protein
MTRLLDLGIDRINKILDDMVRLAEKSFIDAIDSYGKGISLSKNSFRISEKLRMLQDERYVLGHIPGSINTELMQFHWSDTTKNGIKQFNKQNIKLFSNFGIKKILFLFFMKTILGLQLQDRISCTKITDQTAKLIAKHVKIYMIIL